MDAAKTTERPKRQNAAFKHLMLLHWIMAAFILTLYFTGVFVARPLQAPLWLMSFCHQSLGMLFLLLLIVRIFLLLRVVGHKYTRRSPNVTSNWLQTIMLHSSLYFFMLVAPISGFFLRNFIGLGTTLFGLPVPSLFAANNTWVALARSSHFWSSYLFLAFIVLHALAHWKVIRMTVRKRFVTR
ncbi:MAG: cytochrome b/b6 domain-containing protein [Tildeniella nuda ZEHNDER 1965/U140]|jgi:cytochrome b561|nr:cytochrome b/b6 domain-containing protein [Tildeniella nuda ZEHNDER 1965/U140]